MDKRIIFVSIVVLLTLLTSISVYAISLKDTENEVKPQTDLQRAFTRDLIKDLPNEQKEIIINEEIFNIPEEYRVYPELKGVLGLNG